MKLNCRLNKLCFFIMSISSSASFAAEWDKFTLVPSIGTSIKTLTFENVIDDYATFTMVNGSLTAVYGSMQFTVNGESSVGDADVELNNNLGATTRTEYGFSAGYNVWKSASVFIGYLQGKTNAEFIDPKGDVDFGLTRAEKVFDETKSYSFSENGFYLGGSYSHNVLDYGSINVNLAYAILDGEYHAVEDYSARRTLTAERRLLTQTNSIEYYETVVDGTTSGFSGGIRWTAPITNDFAYSIGTKLKMFNFKKDNIRSGSAVVGEGSDRANQINDAQEIYWELGATVSYFF